MKSERHGIGMTSRRTRERLIQRLRSSGITDERLLDVMQSVPRHLFVEEALASRAYEDSALPIGHGQTISQPYIVARMTQYLLAGRRPAKVLEVGTGCGYQSAVLASLVDQVYSVERIEPLMSAARRRLRRLGYFNVRVQLADGSWGWPEQGPYEAIMVTAAPEEVPAALLEQLAPEGRMVIPVGGRSAQELLLFERTEAGVSQTRIEAVNFVPLITGKV